jgi:hypothetical protein
VENLFRIIIISFLISTSCGQKQSPIALKPDVFISLSADSTTIELHRIPKDVLNYFKSDSIESKEWASFFAVYPDSKNIELRDFQPVLSGTYRVNDSLIVFKPDISFKSDSAYFARCYNHELWFEPSKIISASKSYGPAPIAELFFVR